MNYLNSVFWDYPKFKNERYLKKFIKKKDSDIYIWMLRRFIENGRVIDTFKYFKIIDIKNNLNKMKLSNYSLKKWKRLLEVYSNEDKRK